MELHQQLVDRRLLTLAAVVEERKQTRAHQITRLEQVEQAAAVQAAKTQQELLELQTPEAVVAVAAQRMPLVETAAQVW